MKTRTQAIAAVALICAGVGAGEAGWAPPFRDRSGVAPHDGRFRIDLSIVGAMGALSNQEIEDSLRPELDAAYACWREGSTRYERHATLRLKINPLGVVTGAEVVSSSGMKLVDQCLTRAARHSGFPFATASTSVFAVWIETPTQSNPPEGVDI